MPGAGLQNMWYEAILWQRRRTYSKLGKLKLGKLEIRYSEITVMQ